MDGDSIELRELRDVVADKPAFIRCILDRDEDGWTLGYVEAIVGKRPPEWQPIAWEYDVLVLVAQELAGDALATALDGAEGRSLPVGSYQAEVPALQQQQVQCRHEPSRFRLDRPSLPWPVWDYSVYRQGGSSERQRQYGLLIGDGPSFPNFETAFRAFMTGDYSMVGAGSVPTELAKVRVVQSEGWLRRIRVGPTHLDIYVAGDATAGARIEVTGADLHIEKRVGTTGKVRIRLPRGLPTDAWVYLTRDNRWLDYRAFPYRAQGQLDGVEIEVPDDPESQVEALLAQGEGPRIEYKRTLPSKDVDSKRKVLKTVAAFANGSGGSIVFGMDSDEVTLVGLEDVDVPAARDRLGNLIQGIVVPPNPIYSVRSATIDGKLVIVLDVERSPGHPFGLQFQNQPVQFFVRRGASTYPATQEEVRDLAIFDGAPEV